MAKEQGYLVLDEKENYEVLSVLSDAYRQDDIDHGIRAKAGEWIDRLNDDKWGIGGVSITKAEADELLNHLYEISGEAKSDLHINARVLVRYLEHALTTAGERVRRPSGTTQGPGR